MFSKEKREKLGVAGFLKAAFTVDLLKDFLTASRSLFKSTAKTSKDVSEALKDDADLRRGYRPWPEALRRFNVNEAELPEHLKKNMWLKAIYAFVFIVSVFLTVDSIMSEDTLLYAVLKAVALIVFGAYAMLEYTIASWRIRVFSQPGEAWPDFQTFIKEKLKFTRGRGIEA